MSRRSLDTITYQDVDDAIVVVSRAQVQREILAALGTPQKKWQLRTALHLPEHVIAGELNTLRAAGRVKCLGRQQADRAWVLASWSPPPPAVAAAPFDPTRVNEYTVVRKLKPVPAADSWWIDPTLTRAQFFARVLRGADA